MSAAPGSQEPGFKPSSTNPDLLGTSDTKPANNTQTQDRRRSSVDKYGDIMKKNSTEAHSHSHAEQKNSKPGVIGSLFSSYVKGGK